MNFREFKEKYQKKEVEEISISPSVTPVVSVIIQTFNHQAFIGQCLDSILNQKTTFKIEILIGEDASTDKTREICREYAVNNPDKIRLFLHHPANKINVGEITTGNFNAFNNFYNAKGKYIAFCEGDDYWEDPLKLQKQVDFLELNVESAFVYHSYITVDNTGDKIESIEEINQPKCDITKEELLKGKYHPLLLTICFRNVFSEIPVEMVEVLNVDTFMFSYLGKFGKAKFQPNVRPACYRKHKGGSWSQGVKENKFLSKINTFNKLRAYYSKENLPDIADFYQKKMKNTFKMLGWFYLKERKFKKFWSCYFLKKITTPNAI